ncbi:MAG TPA: phasin family protein [Methylocystis sp.]|nr:phasin family protein [Methylocystis sp.]
MTDYFESIQKLGKERFEAAAAASAAAVKEFEAAAREQQDYSKRAFEEAQSFGRKLFSVKSLDEAVKAHSEYFETARRDFWDQVSKANSLYFSFAKKLVKPADGPVAKIVEDSFAKSKAA